MTQQTMTVVAVFKARAKHEARLRSLLTGMLSSTRSEAGCLLYDLHRGESDPGLFFFYEIWTSPEAHAAHLETEHVRHLLEANRNLLKEPIREYRGWAIEPPASGAEELLDRRS